MASESGALPPGFRYQRKVDDELVGPVADFGKSLKVGNGVDTDTHIGLLVFEQQLERVTGTSTSRARRAPRPSSAASS
jgi:aldehyde dehydrogenase (NAD+)